MTTMLPSSHNVEGAKETEAQSWLPALSARNGALAIEHGHHQELGWERRTDLSGISAMVYTDRIENPVIEAKSRFATGNSEAGTVLLDSISSLFHATGPGFSTAGVAATYEHSLPHGNHVRLGYASGSALVLSAVSEPGPERRPATLAQVLASAHPRHTQTYSLSLSGTIEGTGTHWRASYRWQPEETVTQVAPFARNAAEPYLNLHLAQPIHLRSDGSGGFEAVLDVRNLLAEGYRPYLLSDGSLLIFAQDQRAIRAGLAFNF
jgi:hypothetical protein